MSTADNLTQKVSTLKRVEVITLTGRDLKFEKLSDGTYCANFRPNETTKLGRVILITGSSGSGKSYLGANWSALFPKVPFHDLDLTGADVGERWVIGKLKPGFNFGTGSNLIEVCANVDSVIFVIPDSDFWRASSAAKVKDADRDLPQKWIRDWLERIKWSDSKMERYQLSKLELFRKQIPDVPIYVYFNRPGKISVSRGWHETK
jgi:energy-coupling factor transporter ATP-binding protein EcfA2